MEIEAAIVTASRMFVGTIQWGDVAEWVGGLATAAALFVTYFLLRLTRSEQRESSEQRLQDQARRVGATLSLSSEGHAAQPDQEVIEMTVVNASELPVRDVQGYLYEGDGKEVSARFNPIPVAAPGTCSATLQVPRGRRWRLELEFDDDSGYRWLKYRETRLRRFDADRRTLI